MGILRGSQWTVATQAARARSAAGRVGIFFAVALGALCLPLTALMADVITLRSGGTLEGIIVGQSQTEVRIQVGGQVRSVAKSAIRRISYGTVAAVVPKLPAKKTPAKDATHGPTIPKEQSDQPLTPVGRLWRSALLPGFGLWADGQRWEGLAWAGAFLAAGVRLRNQGAAVAESQTAYDFTNGPEKFLLLVAVRGGGQNTSPLLVLGYGRDQTVRAQYDATLQRYERSVGLLAIVYVAQLTRAWFAGGRHGTNAYQLKSQANSWSFALYPEGRGGQAVVRWPVHFGVTQ